MVGHKCKMKVIAVLLQLHITTRMFKQFRALGLTKSELSLHIISSKRSENIIFRTSFLTYIEDPYIDSTHMLNGQ